MVAAPRAPARLNENEASMGDQKVFPLISSTAFSQPGRALPRHLPNSFRARSSTLDTSEGPVDCARATCRNTIVCKSPAYLLSIQIIAHFCWSWLEFQKDAICLYQRHRRKPRLATANQLGFGYPDSRQAVAIWRQSAKTQMNFVRRLI